MSSNTPPKNGLFARVAGWFSGPDPQPVSQFRDPARSNKLALVHFLPTVIKDLRALKPELATRLFRFSTTDPKDRWIAQPIFPDDIADCAQALEEAARVYKKAAKKQAGLYFPEKQHACLYLAAMYAAGRTDEPVSSQTVSKLLDDLRPKLAPASSKLTVPSTPPPPPQPALKPQPVAPPVPLPPLPPEVLKLELQPRPFKVPQQRPAHFKVDLSKLFFGRESDWSREYGADYIAEARRVAGELLQHAQEDFADRGGEDVIISQLPRYIALMTRKEHDPQTLTELAYLFETLADYYDDLKKKQRGPEIHSKKMLALYLAEKFMRNEKATLEASFFARPFLAYCREDR